MRELILMPLCELGEKVSMSVCVCVCVCVGVFVCVWVCLCEWDGLMRDRERFSMIVLVCEKQRERE